MKTKLQIGGIYIGYCLYNKEREENKHDSEVREFVSFD